MCERLERAKQNLAQEHFFYSQERDARQTRLDLQSEVCVYGQPFYGLFFSTVVEMQVLNLIYKHLLSIVLLFPFFISFLFIRNLFSFFCVHFFSSLRQESDWLLFVVEETNTHQDTLRAKMQ